MFFYLLIYWQIIPMRTINGHKTCAIDYSSSSSSLSSSPPGWYAHFPYTEIPVCHAWSAQSGMVNNKQRDRDKMLDGAWPLILMVASIICLGSVYLLIAMVLIYLKRARWRPTWVCCCLPRNRCYRSSKWPRGCYHHRSRIWVKRHCRPTAAVPHKCPRERPRRSESWWWLR